MKTPRKIYALSELKPKKFRDPSSLVEWLYTYYSRRGFRDIDMMPRIVTAREKLAGAIARDAGNDTHYWVKKACECSKWNTDEHPSQFLWEFRSLAERVAGRKGDWVAAMSQLIDELIARYDDVMCDVGAIYVADVMARTAQHNEERQAIAEREAFEHAILLKLRPDNPVLDAGEYFTYEGHIRTERGAEMAEMAFSGD
ncbi:hypothetical protein HUU62_08525 [Rhodoferax sp. 4810]|uniref:Uncharacterized protein n=1 Tax=Thiospirillum jenense TaxID=1653858 RepID=A0A839HE95_9GAMM|nr:hypothetical protein [Thiospirillum jenense]MBB1074453.1 hypothetical protein [Rhodoferax jenense]MBB1125568.1 hypothetical protein [Thiospirillum jenense]